MSYFLHLLLQNHLGFFIQTIGRTGRDPAIKECRLQKAVSTTFLRFSTKFKPINHSTPIGVKYITSMNATVDHTGGELSVNSYYKQMFLFREEVPVYLMFA